ncbi:MAG: N-acetyltransferase [Opitutae bacterium]|nr:N-acetyltransferase [Opitutae bacterium]
MKLSFATMTAADWPEVRRIYEEGIATGLATFETAAPATWDDFIKTKVTACCVVAREESAAADPAAAAPLAGWVALIPVSYRPVYRGVAEASLYVGAAHRGHRVGDALMEKIILVAEAHGFWTLQCSTFPQNTVSLALQKRHGFRPVGTREKIGRMTHGPLAGQWCDTVLYERRSPVVGRD